MERTISDEEKIRRAIEISQRRNGNSYYYQSCSTTRANVNEKKDYNLFKKMILQIIICLLIYLIFHLILTTNYVFSSDVIRNTKDILNYDMDFQKIYNNFMLYINSKTKEDIQNNNIVQENNSLKANEQIIENNVIQNTLNNEVVIENIVENNNSSEENKISENTKEETNKTQMEKDVQSVLKLCKFQKPLSGKITSEFGAREATIEGMTTDHKGIDIAANSGTKIKAVISGTVSVAEENSEYGKFIKIVNGDVMTVYAHCKTLKVKVGEKIKIGQTIATVGSTGTSTGPHLHLEIRYKNRYINPRLLIKF